MGALKWTVIAGGAALTLLAVLLLGPTFGLVLAAVYAALVLWILNEPLVTAMVGWTERARYAIGAVLVVLGVWHFLNSGNGLQVAAALAGVFLIAAFLLVERPWENTI